MSSPASNPVRVGVLGARGRMGSEAVRAVGEDPGAELVASVNREDPLDVLVESGAQVAVDLTHPDAVLDNVEFCVRNGIHAVVGTSGLGPDELERIRGWLADKPEVGVLVAPNFALGAVLSMKFAEVAARFFESVEIVELHHPKKPTPPPAPPPAPPRSSATRANRPGWSPPRTPPPASWTGRAGRRSPTCRCTPSAWPGWWPTRRCCSAPRGRR